MPQTMLRLRVTCVGRIGFYEGEIDYGLCIYCVRCDCANSPNQNRPTSSRMCTREVGSSCVNETRKSKATLVAVCHYPHLFVLPILCSGLEWILSRLPNTISDATHFHNITTSTIHPSTLTHTQTRQSTHRTHGVEG